MSTFADSFHARLKNIEARAKAAGSNMTQVCKATGVARATFERWAHRAPQTIVKVDELDAYVSTLEAARSTPAPEPEPEAAIADVDTPAEF